MCNLDIFLANLASNIQTAQILARIIIAASYEEK